ncbi:MAG: hypothetical protein IJZ72_04145 [Oscillospiraceae bacterium]|nr:hypothetical protein [Oscillospiraceae bacterium]
MAKNQSVKTGKKLRGAVLIMVLTVMFMLIILLLATLTVVSTAQNRSYAKYEENQAYYTARSALDVYVGNMLNDNSYIAYDGGSKREYKYGPDAADKSDMTQGLALQLDLYRIKAHAKTWAEYQGMADKTLFSTDAAANPADSSTTFPYMTDIYPTEDYIEYEITLPDNMIHNDTYGGAAENKGIKDQFGDELKATVKVEVLAREISDKNRTKDMMYVKVTTSVPYQDIMGTTSAIYQVVENPQMFDNAVTSMSYVYPADNTTIIGGVSSINPLTMGNEGSIVGKMYSGELVPYTTPGGSVSDPETQIRGGGTLNALSRKENAYLEGGVNAMNDIPYKSLGVTVAEEKPLVYIDGDFTAGTSVNWAGGASGAALDGVDIVVTGNMEALSNDWEINGNLYVLGDLNIAGNSFKCTGDVVVFGNMNVTGSNLDSNSFTGNYYVMGTADTSVLRNGAGFNPTGVVFSPNQITFYNRTSNSIENTAPGSCTFTYDALTTTYLDVTADISTLGAKITLPEIAAGATPAVNVPSATDITKYERYIPVFTSQYLKYMKIDPSTLQPKSPAEYISAKELVSTTEAERSVGSYNEDKWAEFINGTEEIWDVASETITVNGEEKFKMVPGGAGANGTNQRYLRFSGSGTAHVYIPAGGYAGAILCDDDVTVNFYADTDEGQITWDVTTFSESIANGIAANNFSFGNDTSALPAPKINFYVSGSGWWKMSEEGHSLMCGYFYAPYANVEVNKGVESSNLSTDLSSFGKSFGGSYSYKYSGDYVTKKDNSNITANPMVIGAMVAGSVSGMKNNAVVAYIDPSNIQQSNKGNTLFKWQPVQYLAK